MKEFLTIEDISLMTGLSTRTIRSYLASGQLKGQKTDGAWQFTQEQFSAFLQQDMVRQSARAKENGKIYDFLLAGKHPESTACLIWDWPAEGGEEECRLRERLLEEVNRRGVTCAYHYENGAARAILTGSPAALGGLLAELG